MSASLDMITHIFGVAFVYYGVVICISVLIGTWTLHMSNITQMTGCVSYTGKVRIYILGVGKYHFIYWEVGHELLLRTGNY